MKVAAIVINVLLPGIGTLLVQKWGQAIVQIILIIIGILLIFTVIGGIIGFPLYLAAWIWAIVSAATAPEQPVRVAAQPAGGSNEPENT